MSFKTNHTVSIGEETVRGSWKPLDRKDRWSQTMIYRVLTHSDPHMRTDYAIDILGHISQDCLGATTAIEQSTMVSTASRLMSEHMILSRVDMINRRGLE